MSASNGDLSPLGIGFVANHFDVVPVRTNNESCIEVYVSNALAYEYEDVLSRRLSATRWHQLQPVLGSLLRLAQFTTIYYSWRPTSPDAGDDLVIDCAMNASAIVITSNVRDFESAKELLGLGVITPVQLVIKLASSGS